MNDGKRIRLTGQKLKIQFRDVEKKPYTYEVSIDDYLGEGSSCICYEVTVFKNSDSPGQKRVLKQFYPDPLIYEIQADMQGMELHIKGYSEDREDSEYPELTDLGIGFKDAFQKQNELSNKKECADVIVRPDLCYFNGATKYVLYEADYGTSLDWEKITDLKDYIHKMYQLSCALEKLHGQNLIYMDLKPANILVAGNNEQIKLLDFDSVLDLSHMEEVKTSDIRYASDCPLLIAPEIRMDRLNEFRQNKKINLHQRVDIYSMGIIMLSFFMDSDIWKENKVPDDIEEKLKEIIDKKYRGQLTGSEQDLLCRIIKKASEYDIGGRYNRTQMLVNDLKILKDMVEIPMSHKGDIFKEADPRIRSAYVMDKYPLCKFRHQKKEGEWMMDVLLIGKSPINRAFLMNILGSAQMLDTRIIIRMAVSDPQETIWSYLKQWSLLKKTVEIYFKDDSRVWVTPDGEDIQIDSEIVDRPLAELHFYQWNQEQEIKTFLDEIDHEDISWIIAGDMDLEGNKMIAEKTADYMEISGRKDKIFIGYADSRGDGYTVRQPEKSYANMILLPFSINTKNTQDEKQFEKGIIGRAKFLHKYYLREWNENADKDFVQKDFWQEGYKYNVYSSLCSVLSIPYKLESAGIHERGMQGAQKYQRKVLGKEKRKPEVQERFNQMLYLEHLRWIGFMLTEGYDRPTKEQLEAYAFRGKNDQRNKSEDQKLHPCICSFRSGNGIVLDQLSHEMWEEEDLSVIEARLGNSLDELDRMSVELHQWCGRRIKELMDNGSFRSAFRSLEKKMKEENYPVKAIEMLNTSVKTICQKMLDNDSNVNSLWQEFCRDFSWMLAEKAGSESQEAFEKIRNLMRVVTEHNIYHDYKMSDQSILEVIPLLLISDQQIRRVYKPMAEKNWQNVLSSLIIEPEELILYTDDPEKDIEDSRELLQKFLENERGIHHGNKPISVQICSMRELFNLQITERSVPGVLDITGLPEDEVYRLTHRDNLEKLPVIYYRNGKVYSLTPGSRAEYYSPLRRHLTVKETLRLYNVEMDSERTRNYMLGLSDTYEILWKAYIRMNSFRYRILVSVLISVEKKNYRRLERSENDTVYTFEKNRVPFEMLQSTGLDLLFEKLKQDNWIEDSYRIPPRGQNGRVIVRTGNKDVFNGLGEIFRKIQAHPFEHHFMYLKTHREPFTDWHFEKPLYYIYDDTLLVDEEITESMAEEAENWRDILERALETLARPKDQCGDGILINRTEMEIPFIEKNPSDSGKVHLSFLYQNRSIKECLMKEGNVLETFVYHTIWKNILPDDVKLNVAFTWDSRCEEDSLKPGAISNEVDLVCTYHMQTFFISCKQEMPKTAFLHEIKSLANEFGIDGKAILITSNWKTSKEASQSNPDFNAAELIASRSSKMKVYYIDNEMLGGKNIDREAQGRLVKYLRNIFLGVKDWKKLE